MRLIARSTLVAFWQEHPETRTSLEHWMAVVSKASWRNTNEVKASFAKAKVLNGERVRFEVAGGNYRLIVAFRFDIQIAFIKFIGTHKQYDAIDALTVRAF
jgi:mRNA interferase HigB